MPREIFRYEDKKSDRDNSSKHKKRLELPVKASSRRLQASILSRKQELYHGRREGHSAVNLNYMEGDGLHDKKREGFYIES